MTEISLQRKSRQEGRETRAIEVVSEVSKHFLKCRPFAPDTYQPKRRRGWEAEVRSPS